MNDLTGKTVLITGGARGIGLAAADKALQLGAQVALVDNGVSLRGDEPDEHVVAEAAATLREGNRPVIGIAADVATGDGVAKAVEQTVDQLGSLDGLIASAGLHIEGSMLNHVPEDLSALLDVHVQGAFALCHRVARAMVDGRTPGGMVFLCSPSAFFGAARQSALAAASAAVMGMVRSAAVELRKHGIRVNALAATARTRSTEHLPLFQSVAPDSMTPEQVAHVAAFLVSNHSESISGEVVAVAGNRIYALQARETAGEFFTEPAMFEDLAARWGTVRSIRDPQKR